MIKASISFSDLAAVPQLRNGQVHVGNSRIIPYSHRSLETLVICTEGRWFMTVRERMADRQQGTSGQLEVVSEERFEQLHREALLWPLDYLMVEVAQAGSRLKLRAGVLGTAPVYLRATETDMTVSYDLADFLTRPCALDAWIVSRRLGMHADYSARQICAGVLLLTERAVVFARPGDVRYQYPPAVEPALPESESEQEDSVASFDAWLSQAVQARPLEVGCAAIELSGGMDSATVACALGERSKSLTSLGILLDGNESQQRHRREAVVRSLGLSDHTIAMFEFPPSLDLRPTVGRIEYPLADFYLEAFESLWDAARARRCNVLITGLGGDQLFPVYLHELQSENATGNAIVASAQRRADALLTPAALEASRALPGIDAPPGPLQASLLASNLCQSPHLLRRGLWPISPLGDPVLVSRCQRLPFPSRRDRGTMREYLARQLGPEIFALGYTKETFAPVLPALISGQAKQIRTQLEQCALADMGLVDRNAALDLLDDLVRTRERSLTAPLASFLWMERFVRQFA